MATVHEKEGSAAANSQLQVPVEVPASNISHTSSVTQLPEALEPSARESAEKKHDKPGHGESALPEDKEGEAVENLEEDWECDPENPRNWPAGKKWRAVSAVSFYSFVAPLASSMMAPGLPELAAKYQITNPTVIALTLCVFLISFALAPLILAPISEMYGRTWVLHIGNIFTVAFSIGCAFAPDVGSLIALRFLSGFSGSAPVACGGGTMGDLFSEKDRAGAMALFALGPLIGPVIGPIAGGFIAEDAGMKWVFITIGLICASASLYGIPVLRETYAPVIRLRLHKARGDIEKTVEVAPHLIEAHTDKKKVMWEHLGRPLQILFKSLIAFLLSLYSAVMSGVFYLMFTTFGAFFSETYGFKPGVGGLTYLGLGVGFFLAAGIGSAVGNKIYFALAAKNGGVATPEMRIPALILGSFFLPIGMFWYGWSAHAKLHWIMPIIGSGIFGFGMMATTLPIQLYLVDSFEFAASAVSASMLFRNLLGFAFPLFGGQMFDVMGMGGGNSFLAGLAIVLGIPFPIFLYYRGEQMRANNPLTSHLGRAKV